MVNYLNKCWDKVDFVKKTPIFQAVKMQKISDMIDLNNLILFHNTF